MNVLLIRVRMVASVLTASINFLADVWQVSGADFANSVRVVDSAVNVQLVSCNWCFCVVQMLTSVHRIHVRTTALALTKSTVSCVVVKVVSLVTSVSSVIADHIIC